MCVERAQGLLDKAMQTGHRSVLGIAAPPGAGKSTLAKALQKALGRHAVLVPMDGFHLANVTLRYLQRDKRKGAMDTFDAAGYASLLKRIRQCPRSETIFAPDFDRNIEEAIAAAISVEEDHLLVITEGNYLLQQSGAWKEVRQQTDEVWYLEVESNTRQQQLIKRHMQFGRTLQEAQAWVEQTDEPNAHLVETTRDLADCLVRIEKILSV